MKKIVLIFTFVVFFALNAFAEFSLSGLVGTSVNLLTGTSIEDDPLRAGGSLFGRIQLTGQNHNGTFGGLIRAQAVATYITPENIPSWSWWQPTNIPYAWAWWQPNEIARLQIGFIDDFAVNEIVGWGYFANDAEEHVARQWNNSPCGFYRGTWWGGASLSLTPPIPGLAVNLAVPYFVGDTAEDVYRGIHAQVVYNVGDIGRAALTFAGNNWRQTIHGSNLHPSAVYASFLMNVNDYTDMNFGITYTFPERDGIYVYNQPFVAGFGLSTMLGDMGLNLGDIELKSRLSASIGGRLRRNENEFDEHGVWLGVRELVVKEPFIMRIGVLPSVEYNNFRIYMNTEISFLAGGDFDSAFGFLINPFVTRTIGSGRFYAGFRFERVIDPRAGSPHIQWGIPLAIQFEF